MGYDGSNRMPLNFNEAKKSQFWGWIQDFSVSVVTAAASSPTQLHPGGVRLWSHGGSSPGCQCSSPRCRACCRADPATMYSPSPEKQHFFHGVLQTRKCPRRTRTGCQVMNELICIQVMARTYSPSPAISAWVQALHLFHKVKISLPRHKLWLSICCVN